MRLKAALARLPIIPRNEAALLAARLLSQHGLHGSRWLLGELVEPDERQTSQLDLIAPADLTWLDTCEASAQLLIRSAEAASLPAMANVSALLVAQVAPELRTAWLAGARQFDLAAPRPWTESIDLLHELAQQVSAARDAIAFHLADRPDAAAQWERVVTDWANLVIANHRPLLWALAEREADARLVAQLLPLSVLLSDLAGAGAPLTDLATILPAGHLAAASDAILAFAAEPSGHPRWTLPLLGLAERSAEAASRTLDLDRLLLSMVPMNRDAIVFYVERLARLNDTDAAHYWLSEGQRHFPRESIWDRLLETVGR